MAFAKCSDQEFIRLFTTYGAAEASRVIGCTERNVYARRARLDRYFGKMEAPSNAPKKEYPQRVCFDVKNGTVLIGSDFHIWPGAESLALKAFKKFAKDLKPAAVILNGDVLDFPQISKHSAINWESTPSPIEEIEAAQDHLNDIVKACGRAKKIWTLGNHDARLETKIANLAPQYRGIKGLHLGDHFSLWSKGWASWINDTVVVKHRFKGGVHATFNNAVYSGKTMVTGHLHSANVRAFTDYNGTRWGVDTGCVADPDHAAFTAYTEDAPKNWVSAFGVLTFRDGKLMWPELVTPWGDGKHMQYRGELVKP